jgi:hypothetical protein
MRNAVIFHSWMISAAAAVIASALGAIEVKATTLTLTAEHSAPAQLVQAGCRVFGPFPTMRRANEVANQARSRGYSALPFHNGDGYYVKDC